MKVRELKTFVVGNPPPVTGGRYFILVKLTTDNGIEGIGEVYSATREQSGGAAQILQTSTHMQNVTRQLASAAKEQANGARDMMKAVEVMNRMTQQVADASREQKQGGDLVVKAVERIAHIAQQNLAAAEQLSTNTRNLSQEAEQLLSVAEVFTVEAEVGDGATGSGRG